jgi:hypothetical protein
MKMIGTWMSDAASDRLDILHPDDRAEGGWPAAFRRYYGAACLTARPSS